MGKIWVINLIDLKHAWELLQFNSSIDVTDKMVVLTVLEILCFESIVQVYLRMEEIR